VKTTVHWPSFGCSIAIAAIAGYAARQWVGVNFWVGFLLTAIALLANGWIATAEDEAPGGFNNPKPPQRASEE